ncbi:MAG TPA: hypothetical protein VFZ53_01155 [Polyangiaceae bacterium]
MNTRFLTGALWLLTVASVAVSACGGGSDGSDGGSDDDDDPAGGGAFPTGGAPSGGASSGGASGAVTGGASTGGSAVGGSATGGTAAGGTATGGTAVGGSATGGTATGGTATGGSPSGGSATGGSAMGGSGGSGIGGSGGKATGGSGGKATGGTGGGTAGTGNCTGDTCAFASGVTWQCRKRFMYGLNFAWQSFGGDFGGYGDQRGVAQNTAAINTKLQNWASNGVSVIRWWVWPDFRGNGVTFSGTNPTGLGGTALADLEAALNLANQHDVYLMLNLFSFDGFKTSVPKANLALFATDAARRQALVTNVIRPFARAAQQSPHARRLIAWDLINEPEWSVSGASMYGGDPVFDPQDGMQTVTHAQMETLLRDVAAGLRAESSALITVGGAAMKWKNAWSRLDLDFHQFHIYDWVHTGGWPYNRTPTQYGVNDKPVVMGEFPPTGVGGANYRTVVDYWYGNGYAGALPWQDGTYMIDFPNLKSFADAHACDTQY